jgi:hypothetical protein
MKTNRRKGVLGILNRLASYAKARAGKTSPSSIRAEVEIDRKLLWRWRTVSGKDDAE